MSYRTTIIEVGPEARTFLEERMAITFAGNAPEALRPYCFIIEAAELSAALSVGQKVQIDDQSWTITAIGDVAEQNLGTLGHLTLVFDGGTEAQMPGALHLGGVDAEPRLGLGTVLDFNHG